MRLQLEKQGKTRLEGKKGENATARKKTRENAPAKQCRRGHRRKPVQTGARAWVWCPRTTSGASARARARCPNWCSGTDKNLCSDRVTVPGHDAPAPSMNSALHSLLNFCTTRKQYH